VLSRWRVHSFLRWQASCEVTFAQECCKLCARNDEKYYNTVTAIMAAEDPSGNMEKKNTAKMTTQVSTACYASIYSKLWQTLFDWLKDWLECYGMHKRIVTVACCLRVICIWWLLLELCTTSFIARSCLVQ
jgi:hypothetical protein